MDGVSGVFLDAVSEAAFIRLASTLQRRDAVFVIGAGLSRPEFPDWLGLCDAARSRAVAAGLDCTSLPASPWNLNDYLGEVCRIMGEGPFLSFLKDTLGVPEQTVSTYKAVSRYETVFRIPGAHFIATFNLDELLAVTAKIFSVPVAHYPVFNEFSFTRRGVLYLHGRASTAHSVNEVVMTTSAYASAYAENSELYAILRALMGREIIVFVGSSLEDRVFEVHLRKFAAIRQAIAQQDGVIRADPGMYALLPVPRDIDARRNSELMLKSDGVESIWFDAGDDFRHLDGLLVELALDGRRARTMTSESPDVVWIANVAARLATIPNPTELDVRHANELLATELGARAFFDSNPTPGWLVPLREAGLLTPGEPRRLDDGSWRTPQWHAGRYLHSLAPGEQGGAVAEVLRGIGTDNWIALGWVGDILDALPSTHAMSMADSVRVWLGSRFVGHSNFTHHAISALGRALEDEAVELQDLLDFGTVLLRFFGSEGAEDVLQRAMARNLVDRSVAPLARKAPERLVALGMQLISEELSVRWPKLDDDTSWIVRPAIEPSTQNTRDERLGFLVDSLRVALEALRGAPSYPEIVRALFGNRRSLFRRFAIHEARECEQGLLAIEEPLIAEMGRLLYQDEPMHELLLLFARCRHLPPSVVAAFQHALDNPDTTMSARRAAGRRQRLINVACPGLLTAAQAEDRTVEGEVEDESRFFDIYVGGVFRPEPPISQKRFDDLADGMSAEAVRGILIHPDEHGIDIGWKHDREKLWDLFCDWATRRRARAAVLALSSDDLLQDSTWKSIPVLVTLTSGHREWSETLEWLRRVAGGSRWLAQTVADSLQHGVARSVPDRIVRKVIGLSEELLAAHCAAIEETIPEGGVWRGDGRIDLGEQYLNSVAGQAGDTLIIAAYRTLGGVEGGPRRLPLWLRRDVQAAATNGWGGWQFRVAIGALFPLLASVELNWIGALLPKLLPQGDDVAAKNAKAAFWTGYGWRSREVFEVCVEPLRPYLEAELTSDGDQSLISPGIRERLVDHVVIAAIRDATGYRALLEATLQGPVASRSRVIESFSGLLRASGSDDLDRETQRLALAYAAGHLAAHGRDAREPWDRYALWFERLGTAELRDLVPLLRQVIAVETLSHEFHWIMECLAARAPEDPAMVLRLVLQVLETHGAKQELHWYRDDLKEVLSRVARVPGTAQAMRPVVNLALGREIIGVAEANELLSLAYD